MDTLFFMDYKLISVLLPVTWIILALAAIVLALDLNHRRLELLVGSFTLSFLVALAILPPGTLLLQPIESTYRALPLLDQVDRIIVLRGGEDAHAGAFWRQMQLIEGVERSTVALALARRIPQVRVPFNGGSDALRDLAGAEMSGAEMAKRCFDDQGTGFERLLLEGQSRSTADETCLSRDLAAPPTGESLALVRSAIQMHRALRSFDAAGGTGMVS